MGEELEFYVAGVQYHDLHKCIRKLKKGDGLWLVPEPENSYDSNAVKIMKDDIMLGYVPAKHSASVAADIMIGNPICSVVEVNPQAKPWEKLKVRIKEEQ